tara:strand:+ start:315 stop:527 length:213 start_codon:yes stop_codon:yes gene_type:complete
MIYRFLKQYNTKEKKMIPPNKFDKIMLVIACIGLILSVSIVMFSQVQILLLAGWLFMIASLGMIFKLLGL